MAATILGNSTPKRLQLYPAHLMLRRFPQSRHRKLTLKQRHRYHHHHHKGEGDHNYLLRCHLLQHPRHPMARNVRSQAPPELMVGASNVRSHEPKNSFC